MLKVISINIDAIRLNLNKRRKENILRTDRDISLVILSFPIDQNIERPSFCLFDMIDTLFRPLQVKEWRERKLVRQCYISR